MKNDILKVLEEYLDFFKDERKRQAILQEYLSKHTDDEIIDWNNFAGHIVASGFIYSKEDNKFLVMYHNDMKIFTYPGGHVSKEDTNPLEAAKREVEEETSLHNFEEVNITNNPLVPIDIDTHLINYNERLDLPEHYHFDFRYLFVIDKSTNIILDTSELSSYKWIDMDELKNDPNFGSIVNKLKKFI